MYDFGNRIFIIEFDKLFISCVKFVHIVKFIYIMLFDKLLIDLLKLLQNVKWVIESGKLSIDWLNVWPKVNFNKDGKLSTVWLK